MILIVSRRNDFSTFEVAKWLNYLDASFVRIDREDKFVIRRIEIGSPMSFLLENVDTGKSIDLGLVSAVWYRRGFINLFEHLPF